MQYRTLSLALVVAAVLSAGSALAADPAKPSAAPPSSASAPAVNAAKSSPSKPAKKPKPVDLNSASAEQLKTVPGVDDARAEKIIRNRPYPTRAYLVTKDIYTQGDYYGIKDYFVATPPAGTPTKAKK